MTRRGDNLMAWLEGTAPPKPKPAVEPPPDRVTCHVCGNDNVHPEYGCKYRKRVSVALVHNAALSKEVNLQTALQRYQAHEDEKTLMSRGMFFYRRRIEQKRERREQRRKR